MCLYLYTATVHFTDSHHRSNVTFVLCRSKCRTILWFSMDQFVISTKYPHFSDNVDANAMHIIVHQVTHHMIQSIFQQMFTGDMNDGKIDSLIIRIIIINNNNTICIAPIKSEDTEAPLIQQCKLGIWGRKIWFIKYYDIKILFIVAFPNRLWNLDWKM